MKIYNYLNESFLIQIIFLMANLMHCFKSGASVIKCTSSFAGNEPFSEIRTRSLVMFLKSIAHKLFTHISFHSSEKKWEFPYKYTDKKLDNSECDI